MKIYTAQRNTYKKKKKSALEILLQAQIKSQHTYISEHKLKALYNSIRTDKNDNR